MCIALPTWLWSFLWFCNFDSESSSVALIQMVGLKFRQETNIHTPNLETKVSSSLLFMFSQKYYSKASSCTHYACSEAQISETAGSCVSIITLQNTEICLHSITRGWDRDRLFCFQSILWKNPHVKLVVKPLQHPAFSYLSTFVA